MVDEENPNLLKLAVEQLSVDTERAKWLAKAAENAAADCFSPSSHSSRIHQTP